MSESISSMRRIRVHEGERTLFFPAMATVMMLIALVGFSRTFYFRAFTGVEDPVTGGSLPLQVVIHGFVFSLWMLIFLLQSWLVFARRIRVHRTLGYAGLATAVLVVVFGAIATIYFVPRAVAANVPTIFVTGIFTGNFIALFSFMVFVALAFHWRRKPESHKRMMFFATVSIIAPALATGERPLGNFLVELFPRPGIVVPMALVVLLLVYDYLRDGRLRRLSLWSGLAVAAKYAVNLLILAPNETVQAAVLSLA